MEDNDDARLEVANMLSGFFKVVDTAVNGQDGLVKYKHNDYDIVVSDINMPVMNGVEMVKKIKDIEKDQPIIIISAHDESKYLIDLINAGVNRFILKPLENQKVIDLLLRECREIDNKKILAPFKTIQNPLSRGSRDAIVIVDKKLRVVEINDAARKRYRVPHEKVVGKTLDLLLKEYDDNCIDAMKETIKYGRTVNRHNVECKRKGGQRRLVTVTTQPLLERLGTASGGVMILKEESCLADPSSKLREPGQLYKITDKDLGMERIEELPLNFPTDNKIALGPNVKTFQTTLEDTPIPVFVCGKGLKLHFCNNAFSELVGLSHKEMKSKKITSVLPLIKEKEVQEKVDAALLSGFRKVVWNERLINKKFGTGALLFLIPIENSERVLGYIYCLDNLEDLVAAMEQRIYKEKVSVVEYLAGVISHEIRNPLTVINSNAQFCLKHYADNKDLRKSLNAVVDSVGFTKRFTEELLGLTRKEYQLKLTQIQDIIKKSINLLKTDLSHKHIKIYFRSIKHIPRTYIDSVKMEQVFINVLLNAMNALKKGGSISVSCTFDRQAENIIIRFGDSGKGIPEKHIKDIFDPFVSLSENGNGLGLAICQKIVDGHNGKIFAENIKKKGAQITIQLPLLKKDNSASVVSG